MATVNRVRPSGESDQVVSVYDSTARIASPDDVVFSTGGRQHLVLVIDITAAADTPSVVFTIKGWDPVTATEWTILASAAKTGTGDTILQVGPDIAASANLIAQHYIPAFIKITAVHADGDSITYSVNAHLGG